MTKISPDIVDDLNRIQNQIQAEYTLPGAQRNMGLATAQFIQLKAWYDQARDNLLEACVRLAMVEHYPHKGDKEQVLGGMDFAALVCRINRLFKEATID